MHPTLLEKQWRKSLFAEDFGISLFLVFFNVARGFKSAGGVNKHQ